MTKSQYRAARALIADPAHWVRNWFAITATGSYIHGDDPLAIAWCAYGACEHVTGLRASLSVACLNEAAMEMYNCRAVEANDTVTHIGVLAMFDRAIELAPDAEGV